MEDPDDQDQASPDELETRKIKAPLEAFRRIQPGPLPPIAPDGGLAPGPVGMPPPAPPATPKFFVCLRGPCRHYWEMVTEMPLGNPAETFGEGGLVDADGAPVQVPHQITRTCTAHPGTETDLTDDNVYSCNRWDPLEPSELKKLRKRQDAYLREHPEHDPNR